MMDDLLIINDTGQLLFSWHPEGKVAGDDDLVSGFFTAVNTFATFERGEDIKSLKLKETNIIFEKNEENLQKLTFVATTKNEDIIEILHSVIHDIIENFIEMFKSELNKEFTGEITHFFKFKEFMEEITKTYGLDIVGSLKAKVDEKGLLKSIIFIEPKGGNILYIYAKQHVNKEKISFLVPLLINSARLLCQGNLNEKIKWILLNTIRNENLLVEIRDKVLIVKQYEEPNRFEERFMALEFFKEKSKYVKKPKILVNMFENISWDARIKQIYLVDLFGKIFYSKILDENLDCNKYIAEAIGFLTSSKRVSQEIYNRLLFNASLGGERLSIIMLNFNNFGLFLISNAAELSDFSEIQNICVEIFKQMK